MISKHEKLEILSQVLKSAEFRDSSRYRELLTYLIKASIEERNVKESQIAIDCFNKDSTYDPSDDSTIRVYISNLRKKLEHFYYTDGRDAKYLITIPKGHYEIKFKSRKEAPELIINPYKRKFYAATVFSALLAFIVIFLLIKSISRPASQLSDDHPVWNSFVSNEDKSTTVVLGDYLFLFERDVKNERFYFIRDTRINSRDDFQRAARQNPEIIKRFVIADFTYIRPSAVVGVSAALPILWKSPNKIFFKLASEIGSAEMSSNNILFIGSFKTVYGFKELFQKFNLIAETSPASLTVKCGDDSTQKFIPENLVGGSYQKDYGVIIKTPGPNDNIIVLLLGFDDVGISEAARYFADPDLLGEIQKFHRKDLPEDFYFELVIEAEGINQTSFNSQIKFFQLLDGK